MNYFLPDIEYQDVKTESVLDKKSARELEVSVGMAILEQTEQNLVWGVKEGGSFITKALFHKDDVIFGSCDRHVYSVNRKTGKLSWKFGISCPILYIGCVYKGMVFFGSFDENVYCLDADTGRKKWAFDAGSPVATGPNV
mgnify:CR=1 FL=1